MIRLYLNSCKTSLHLLKQFERVLCRRASTSTALIDGIDTVALVNYIESCRRRQNAINDSERYRLQVGVRLAVCSCYVQLINERGVQLQRLLSSVDDLERMIEIESTDMKELAEEELVELQAQLAAHVRALMIMLYPAHASDSIESILVEIDSGAGGTEASIFADELHIMYERFAAYRHWQCTRVHRSAGALPILNIKGPSVYKCMKFEGGVHRVQRVPTTDRSGRTHTSTASVAIVPEPSEIDVQIDRKDLNVTYVRCGGPGGMNRDHSETGVRIVHIPTGIVVERNKERYSFENEQQALQQLRTLLYQREHMQKLQSEQMQRKLQVGTRERSEKIRTYNFLQDRVTDHRIKESFGDIQGIMQGGAQLDAITSACHEFHVRETVVDMLKNYAANT